MSKSRIKKNTRIKQRERVKRRKKEKAKKFLKGVGKLSLVFLMVAAVAAAGKKVEDFLLTSPHFRLSEVNFEGLNSLEKKTLEGLAKIELGKNIFQVDLEEIRRRLQGHPQVREVTIYRQFPRRVEVKVKEREAVVLIQGEGDKVHPLDREGFILPVGSFYRSLPLIIGLGRGGMRVGERVGEVKLAMALDISETFSSFGLLISGIDLEELSPIVKIGEVRVLLGKESERERQVKELKAILNDLQKRQEKAEYIDLRFNNPVVKLREKSVAE
ncbi:FtsQ-type POTRA domain-containing protein [candidate division NPL-UPA2 bacterium]|nr:FtsQ-type POTRA domain-containing protein [candidate division NPL-UPA2 bacterium]